MDITTENVNINPRENANPLSVIFFTYTIGLFYKGYKKTLEVNDLYNPLKSDRSSLLGNRLEKKWNRHLLRTKKLSTTPSLLKVLLQTFWPEYLGLAIILILMDLVFRLMQPLMLGKLLDYFTADSTVTRNDALLYAGAVVGLNAATAFLANQYMLNSFHYGMKVNAACCAVIYRKALRLSRTALGETASGKVVNLLSNDVSRFHVSSYLVHYLWISPVAAIIIACFLWYQAGVAGIVGLIPVFIIVPLQSYTGKISARFRRQTAYKTDERIRLMDEIISGVQVIKMYAWEIPFGKLIKHSRILELKVMKKLNYVRGLYMTFNLFTARVALFCSLLTLALTDSKITAAKVFVFTSYFNILQHSMSQMFIRAVAEVAEALVAIKRIEQFMLYEEKEDIIPVTNAKSTVAIALNNITAKWNPNSVDDALTNLNVMIEKGKLIGVIGTVGSGKSSLLQTILGELHIINGNLEVNGKLSYASQEPWVFAATIRQNIIFGQNYDPKRYNDVIQVCAFEKDLKQFPDGDLSIVGDRGASLSGGQKARINLARAIYREADVYLLDDPLSAVDAPVAKHLYRECINGYLANKTRILVTHQVYHLKDADNIIILNNGNLEIQGTFNELANSDNDYAKLLTEESEQNEEDKLKGDKLTRQISIVSRTSSVSSFKSESSISESLAQEEGIKESDIKIQDLQEESSKGKVKGPLFFKYLLAGGSYCCVGTVLMLYLYAQVAASTVDYFVSIWVKVEEDRISSLTENNYNITVTYDTYKEVPTETFLYIYGGLILTLFVVAFSRSFSFYNLATSCSQNLHDVMFSGVICTTMRFFDTNPSGRILNRFSKDIGSIDELLPKAILDAGQMILLMVGSLILVAIVKVYFLIPVAITGAVFIFLRVVYLKTSKNIKRLEGITRSPVFTHLNATLQGLTTIRAYGAQTILKAEFDKHQDLYSSAWYMYITTSSAFGFTLDILCLILTTVVTFSFLSFSEDSPGADVGLAITQASTLTGMIQWGVRQSADVANQLMSVERVLEYALMPSEPQPVIPKKPDADWPKYGKIAFEDVGLKYSETSPLVLKSLNVVILPKEKIGIVGRTGAGKSSLISALFRLAIVEGNIEIDGLYTKDLNIHDLRSKIAIIPQDPVLFSGTLRYNLDPFEEYTDEVLYKALGEVELKDPANIINRLENRVMDRGSNYSVGQRQLICLARAIIRNNRILVLDEATANVDPQTDAVIQKTIREKFANCTVLTIAHRLNTIMDSDKVLVMDAGSIAEYNHPYLLLQNHKGIFYRMVSETGKPMKEQLKTIAKHSYEEKHGVPE
ncbi:hypothetical protein ILUMI_23292 [Ignelater luminosus]|uniref:Uncharacterized protein n=1 Tax=Ignelater luminosus TaxID=2038154 RepID=A0A8K0FZS1_IGNLU|nr:hypothetical protein ILUMI_23292 [Ignelater luminosus]